jgi:2-oxoglutarate ferredoxin oxidoreductase subunit gamma
LKFQSILQSGGLILVNSSMINVSAARGDIEVVEVPTSELAEKLGNIKAANMVMLGAFIKASNLVSLPLMLKNLPEILGEGKAKLIKINKEALETGYNYIKE